MEDLNDLYHFMHEIEYTSLLKEVTESLTIHSEIILKKGYLIDVRTGEISIWSIKINNGTISEIDLDIQESPSALVIDCTDKYILPGLIDMHVHLDHGNSQHLLHLLHGITTVREMCGFPGILTLRDEIRNKKIIGPDLFVASTMLNDFQMSRYTYAISDEQSLREKIREFKQLGYDYLKIWNVINSDNLNIIFDEADKLKFPVVGHIPHNTKIKHVLEKGMRTLEHFKGYIEDSTMKLTEENYTNLTPKIGNWNCPTLLIHLYDSLTDDDASNFLATDPSMNYVSRYKKDKWGNEISEKSNEVKERGYNIPKMNSELQEIVFKNLVDENVEFISGTDMGGGFILGVPGVGLIDELIHMNQLGLSILKTLQSSTINAAKALTDTTDRGEIKDGMRGDLLILDNNPLIDLNALKGNFDVLFNGRYLTNNDKYNIGKKIENIANSQPKNKGEEMTDMIVKFYLNEKLPFIRPIFIDPIISMIQDQKILIEIKNRSLNYSNNAYDELLE